MNRPKTQAEIIQEANERYAEVKAIRERNRLHAKFEQGKLTRGGRRRLLKQQDGQCALCCDVISADMALQYEKQTGTIICTSCKTYLTFWRIAQAKGVTEERTIEFLSQVQYEQAEQEGGN